MSTCKFLLFHTVLMVHTIAFLTVNPIYLFRIHQYHHLLHHLPSYISSRYLNQLLLSSTLPTIKFFHHTTCLQNSSSHYILQTKFSFLEFIYLFLFYLPLNGIDFLSTTLFFHSKKYL